ncbi:MAG: glutathione S-transferase family protein [Gammaproteobacteria bacterium]
MKFYDCNMAPNPRRARIFMAEKGIKIPMVDVNILDAENLREPYLSINPRGLVPTLELDDGTRFDEVMAICRYFEELYPTPNLLGRTPVERALVESYQRKAEFEGMIAGSEAFRNQHEKFVDRSIPGGPHDKIPTIPGLVARGRQTIDRFHAWLEKTLAKSEYLVGDFYSMADVTAQCAVDFHKWIKVAVPEANVQTQRWYRAVAARPSASA